MHDHFKKNKRSRPIFLEEDEGAEEAEGLANKNATTSSLALAVPSSGTAAKRRATYNFEAPATKDAKPKETKTVAAMIRKTPEEIMDERRSGRFQSTMERSTKSKEDKHYVDMQWALWFYECGMPFNVVASRQFEIACQATAQYGSGYKPMSKHMLREPLLQDCVKETSKMKVDHELAWKHYGCTLMSDGWTDRRGRHLINFLVNSMEWTYFLESVDASSEAHDATMLADLLEKRIEIIGKDKVVQVVIDNDCLRASAPLLIVLRAVDGDEKPAMPEIHTKKRNQLVHKRLNDVVFVAYNRKMKTRFQLRRENAGKAMTL
uniref:DUF659 domain-containing protein n=1 Tax=Oryza brachyantha TaxID=4533 RepID=J3MSA6_ORYBR